MRDLIVIAHDMRSTHNVGSLFRTAEGLGVSKIYLTGYTPHPGFVDDTRLPYIVEKLEKQIDKTALGASAMVNWQYEEDATAIIGKIKDQGYRLVALEQAPNSTTLHEYTPPDKVALLLGNEVDGLDQKYLDLTNDILEIPMFGKKESFNVIQATAMALYQLRFH